MAIVIAAAAAAGLAVVATQYDDHSDHSDYSNYSDYDNYSDAAERKRRRVAAMKQEIETAAKDLEAYKASTVNPRLDSPTLKQTPAMEVSSKKMDEDAQQKIQAKMTQEIDAGTSDARAQMEEIDKLLKRIREIQKAEAEGGD